MYGRLSQDCADQQPALGTGKPTYEMPLELGYRFQLIRFAYIQPDIQYVIRPGALVISQCHGFGGVSWGILLRTPPIPWGRAR